MTTRGSNGASNAKLPMYCFGFPAISSPLCRPERRGYAVLLDGQPLRRLCDIHVVSLVVLARVRRTLPDLQPTAAASQAAPEQVICPCSDNPCIIFKRCFRSIMRIVRLFRERYEPDGSCSLAELEYFINGTYRLVLQMAQRRVPAR